MRRIRTEVWATRGAAVLIASALFACSGSGPRVASAPPEAHAQPELEVATALVRRGAIQQSISAPGTLEARRESRIGPEVQGTLLRVLVDEGDRVEAGQVLFEIDPEPYQFALRQAEAGLELARAQRLQVEADLGRARALGSQAIVSEQTIQKLETGLAVARAEERRAAESVALARHRLAQTRVRAPYAGSVAARLVDEGTTALVQPQTIVLVLQENDVLVARAALAESQLFRVRPGDPARIHLEGLAAAIETEVVAVGDAIDPATRTYSVRLLVPNPGRALKAGVFARVEIRPQALADVVLVPREAIHGEDGGSRVLTIEEGVVISLPVRLGAISEEAVELLAGPPIGTPVIVGAAAQLAPGMRVRALAAGEPGA